MSEPQKIVLQDLIAERAKLRDGIPDTLRYAGIVLAALITWLFSSQPPTQQAIQPGQELWFANKMVTLAWFSVVLIGGFVLKVIEMIRRLKQLKEVINEILKPACLPMDDQHMVNYGNSIRNGIGVVLVIMILTGTYFWRQANKLQHEALQQQTPAALRPNSLPPASSVPPAYTTSQPLAKPN